MIFHILFPLSWVVLSLDHVHIQSLSSYGIIAVCDAGYVTLSKNWPENTDPSKFVFEDIGIAT